MKKILFVIMFMAPTVFSVNWVFADKIFTLRDVKGRYIFSFQGEVVEAVMVGAVVVEAVVVATGVLTADGKGNITDGVRMISINGVPATQTFTCSIIVHPNGTGSAECPLDDPGEISSVETYNFVLQDNGKGFRFIGTTAGSVVSGTGERQ
jgi:hypothetical protein